MTSEIKKKRNRYNAEILKRLIEKFGYGERYITMCLAGDNKSEMADVFIKEYAAMLQAVKELLKSM